MQTTPKPIALSENVYRKLLRLYPQSHRHEYADLLAQLFRDQCRDAYRKDGSVGLLYLCLQVLPDIGKTSIMEQINTIERNQISTVSLLRAAAVRKNPRARSKPAKSILANHS